MLVLVYNLVNTLGGFMLNTMFAAGGGATHRGGHCRRPRLGRP